MFAGNRFERLGTLVRGEGGHSQLQKAAADLAVCNALPATGGISLPTNQKQLEAGTKVAVFLLNTVQ